MSAMHNVIKILLKNATGIKVYFPVFYFFMYFILLFLFIRFGYANANYTKSVNKTLLRFYISEGASTLNTPKSGISNAVTSRSNEDLKKLSKNRNLTSVYRNKLRGQRTNDHEYFICLMAKFGNSGQERRDHEMNALQKVRNVDFDDIEPLIDSFNASDESDSYYYDYVSPILPKGCEYLAHDLTTKTVFCKGQDMTVVPVFTVRSADILVFNRTGIQVLDRDAVEKLPRVSHLVFMRGVLMRVSFSDIIYYQPGLTNLTLIHNSISTITFSNFYTQNQSLLQVLDLRHNLITYLPEAPVRDETVLPNLEILMMSGNPVGVIPGDIFYPLRASPLKTLFLREAGLSDYGTPTYSEGSSPLIYLNNLEVLDLSRNPQFLPDKLDGLLSPLANGTLKELILNDNSYLQIPTAALNAVKDTLEILSIARSSFYCLDPSAFPLMPKLRMLHLPFSRITQIMAGTFDPLIALQVLNLDGNILTTLPHSISLSTLKVLTISENPSEDYTSDDSFNVIKNSMNNSQNLEKLSMQQVPLQNIYDYFFEDVKSLQFLDLSMCQISTIDDRSFVYLAELTKLYLTKNNLKYITKHTLEGLTKLLYLDLSQNSLDFSDETQLFSYVQSAQFQLNYNKLINIKKNIPELQSTFEDEESLIPIDVFHFTYNLKYLNMRHNNINFLRPAIFKNLENLQVVDFSYNRIKIWNETLFDNNGRLHFLKLRYNEINTFTQAMVKDLSKPNLVVDLRDNLFSCSCSLLAFEQELNGTFFVDRNSYKCANGTELMYLDEYLPEAIPCEDSGPLPEPIGNPVYKHIKLYSTLSGLMVISLIVAITTYRNRWYLKYLAYKFRLKVGYNASSTDSNMYEYDTFVCYAHADRQWIFEKLIGKLEESGLRVCVHERDFLVGEEITLNIIRCVEISRKVIVVISRAFVQSNWCMFELQMASNKILDERKNKLILLILESIPPNEQPKDLKLLLKRRTYVNWVSDIEGERLFWARLLRVIAKPTSDEQNSLSESSDQQFDSKGSLPSSSSSVLQIEEISDKNSTKEIDQNPIIDGFSTIGSNFSFRSDLEFGIVNSFYVNEIEDNARGEKHVGYINFGTDVENPQHYHSSSTIVLAEIENSEA